jgi:murein DD-endopeptidase MepM/ murein hydrolase activator NlpD
VEELLMLIISATVTRILKSNFLYPTYLCISFVSIYAAADPVRSNVANHWVSPIQGYFVGKSFGAKSCRQDGKHRGVDMVTTEETAVIAPADGLVIVAGKSDPFFAGHRNLTVIDHGDGTTTVYANLGVQLVQVGDSVKQGQRIAMTQVPNQTSKESITHVEVIYRGKAIDPFERLPYVFFDLQLPAP